MERSGKCQVVTCSCGATFAACALPYAYEDSEWMRDLRKYSKKGYNISIMNSNEFDMQMCTCSEENTNPNQLELTLN
jgi:hypothetical protein